MADFKTTRSNVEVVIEGDTLTMKVNLKGSAGSSKSGKSELIATTNGLVYTPEGVGISVNVIRKK